MELTILMPCLNEENTVAACVSQAVRFLKENGIDGEVLVVDNGSADSSARKAADAGARVQSCMQKGYGNALKSGLHHAKGIYVIMADCDCSYSFTELQPFLNTLRAGAELVVGDRFAEPMEKGAMSFSHRYLGVPVLSCLGRRCFHTDVRDFHCGLRAVNRVSYLKLGCCSEGMEFATEMIGRAALYGQRIKQVPVHYRKDRRGHHSHLHSVRDGLRHLRLMWNLSKEANRSTSR